MIRLFDGPPLYRKIMLSFVLVSVFFISLLSLVVFYANEVLEEDLLERQTRFELEYVRELLAANPDARLPESATRRFFLASRGERRPLPAHIADLAPGVYHDIRVGGRAYHILVASVGDDRIVIENDVSELERSEELLALVLAAAWLLMIIALYFIARGLGRKLSQPVAELSRTLEDMGPDRRGVQLGHRFADDEVGSIARAFDAYTRRMDDYVEKQMAFAAMASHELRSPLTIIHTSADLIASGDTDPRTRAHLERILRATQGMAQLIHALLAVTRDLPAEETAEAFSPAALIDEICESLAAEATAKRIEINNHIDPAARLEADRVLAQVVLTNLVRNAVKHGENSRIDIDFDSGRIDIRDTGAGIAEADLARLFDFGYRGAQSRGLGVGLYLSKLVCDRQGWGLELRPNPGGGTLASVDFVT